MFGSKVPDVLQDMKRAKFRDEVIGPLGLYVKIAVCFCHFIFGVYVYVCVCVCVICASASASVLLALSIHSTVICCTPRLHSSKQG
jgi:hypothetical protein